MRPISGAVLAVLVFGRSAAGEVTILDQSGSGVVSVNDEKLVKIHGIEGEIVLQHGEKGSLELDSSSIGKAGGVVPLALSTDGEAFGLEPPAGQTVVKSRLRLVIPPAMRVVLDASDATILASQLDSELTLRGSRIRLDATGLLRRFEAEIEGGSVTVQSAAQGITLKGRDIDARLDGVVGPATVRLSGGSTRLSGFQSGLQGEFVRTRVGVDTIAGSVSLRFQEGKAQIAGLREGGQIAATACPLVLNRIEGSLTITSDSDVQLSDSRASIHVENSAGVVTGTRIDGVVEVSTHRAAVNLTQISGELRVTGDELQVSLRDIGATTTVSTQASNISIEGTATATVENVGGDVVVKNSESPINVKSQNGEVHLLGMRGSVNVDAAGELVEVEFAQITPEADSRIENDGGEVRVTFLNGDSKVDATSRFGRVLSSLKGVPVGKGESTARGVLGGGSNRTVFVRSSGDVHLLGGEGSEPAGQAP